MADNFNFFLPLTKVDAKTRTVSGYASTPALDLDGEVVSLDAIKKALPGYWEYRNVREMHTTSAVGVGKEANIDEKGLFLTAKIVDDAAWEKCLEGVYKGFSIGGRKLAKSGNTITEIEWIETSIVDRPANPECKFEVAKRAKDTTAPAYLMKVASVPRFRDPASKAVAQMAKAVKTLAKSGPPAAHDGFSLPAVVKSAMCKAHSVADCADCKCAVHGAMDCEKCLGKREVGTKERESLASEGNALPGGGFPIKNKKDLDNARQAVGRAKDPSAARALIRRRAKDLGVKLPDKWSKKLAKRLIAEAELAPLDLAKTGSALPSFLTLGADTTGDEVESGHELDLGRSVALRKDLRVNKRMGIVGSLSYCFDQLRDAQRSLIYEAKREGGDLKDKALADRLGKISSELAAVIGQKAEHEGAEALDLTDADDTGLNLEDFAMTVKTDRVDPLEKFLSEMAKAGRVPSRMQRMELARGNLKKARKAREEATEAIKAAHAMHKAAYLAKAAGKKKDDSDEEFNHTGAMSKLQKAYGELEKLGTFVKAANMQLKKMAARSGQQGQQPTDSEAGIYEVPAGVKTLSPVDLATAGPGGNERGSEPPILGMEQPYPGKVAKQFRNYVSPEMAALMAKAAAAEAKVEVLEKMPAMPASGRRPAAFDVSKLSGDPDLSKSLFRGVNTAAIGSGNESAHTSEVGKIIGNMILGGHGKSVMDPAFHGRAAN